MGFALALNQVRQTPPKRQPRKLPRLKRRRLAVLFVVVWGAMGPVHTEGWPLLAPARLSVYARP